MGNQERGLQIRDELPDKTFASPLVSREVKRYQVLEPELESLAAGAQSIKAGLSGTAIGVAVSFGLGLASGQVTSPVGVAILWVGLVAAVVFALFFGIGAWRDRSSIRAVIRRIKGQRPI